MSPHTSGNTLGADRIRIDPDALVDALTKRGYTARIGLDRIVLLKSGYPPLLVSLRHPLLEVQVRRYLALAQWSEADADAFMFAHGKKSRTAFRPDEFSEDED